MSHRQGSEAARLAEPADTASRSAPADASSPVLTPPANATGTRRDRRLRALSAYLVRHQAMLLPLATQLRDREPTVESTIRGSSMEPAIRSRSRLRVELLGQEACRPGDVVYYLAGDGYVVHRVVYRGSRGRAAGQLLTCGDFRIAPDPPVQDSQVLGRVVAVETRRGWEPPPAPRAGPRYKRVLRASSLAIMVAALRCSPRLASQLATALLELECAARLAVRRLQRARRRSPR